MDGWIKLHRSILESAVFDDLEILKIWIWLLCSVSYSSKTFIFNGSTVSVSAGQVATGRKKIAAQTGMDEARVYRALNVLKKMGKIDIKSTNKYSIISMVNWEKYQGEMQNINIKITANSQQNHSKPTSELQQNDIKSTSSSQQTYTIKEIKEIKEGKEIKKDPALAGETISCSGDTETDAIDFGLSKTGIDF